LSLRRLLIRPGAIGDFIVSMPAMECLRAACLEIWCAEQNVPLARFADAACSLGSTGLDLLGLPDVEPPPRLIERLRGFDSIVSWYGTNRREFRQAVRGLPFHFLPALPSGCHAVDFHLARVRALARCHVPPVPRIRCEVPREDFVVIHPFASRAAKRWPLDRFEEVARRLGARWPVRWCAGPDEPLGGAVRIADLYELACWLARARLYLGNDSGIAHLAAAAGTPVVVLFGPTDPAVWAPRGPRVRVLAPMESITPAQVVAAAECIIG